MPNQNQSLSVDSCLYCISTSVWTARERKGPLHIAKRKLVFPKPSAWANYWALVRKVVLLSCLASLEQNAGRGGWKNFSVTLEPATGLELFFICITEWSTRRRERKGKKGRIKMKRCFEGCCLGVWREGDVRIWRYPPEGCLLACSHPWLLKHR